MGIAYDQRADHAAADPRSDLQSGLSIEVGSHRATAFRLVRLHGELDCATTSDLAMVLSALLGEGVDTVVIDLAGLTFLDLAGARMLGTASVLFEKRGGEVVLLAPRAAARRVLQWVGLEHLATAPVPDTLDLTALTGP